MYTGIQEWQLACDHHPSTIADIANGSRVFVPSGPRLACRIRSSTIFPGESCDPWESILCKAANVQKWCLGPPQQQERARWDLKSFSHLGSQWDIIKKAFAKFPPGSLGAMATTERIMHPILSSAFHLAKHFHAHVPTSSPSQPCLAKQSRH